MNYQETVAYLYSVLPMFSRTGSDAIKKDLTNTRLLCEGLGNPQEKFKTIHIAGTNGKGSVSHMLAAVFQQNGYKTGLYTSPHLYDFRERIKVNGEMITEDFVIRFTEDIQPAITTIQPSFFEITVAMAFDYFAKENVDIAIIETGLGGRLDSTNIILPEIAVITNIGLDHVNILGNTMKQIAREKAGIIKPNIPVVIGECTPETEKVFVDTAAERHAPLVFADKQMYCDDFTYSGHQLNIAVVESHNNNKTDYQLDLTGLYQTKNLVTVLTALQQLRTAGWQLDDRKIKQGLATAASLTGLHGRWELVRIHPTVVLDVGHNEAGIRQLCEQIELTDYQHLHIILGMVKDKDVEAVTRLLPREALYYFTKAQIPRAMPEEELALIARNNRLNGNAYTAINGALKAALNNAGKKDLVIICGSVFLIAEADRNLIKSYPAPVH